MTDTMNGYAGADNARATELNSVNPMDAFNSTLDTETLESVAQWLRAQDVQTVRQALIDYRNKYRYASDMHQHSNQRNQGLVRAVGALSRRVAYEAQHAHDALQQAHTDDEQVPITAPEWANHLSVAFEVGLRVGLPNETRTLATYLDTRGMGAGVHTDEPAILAGMVERLIEMLRDENGQMPDPVASVQAVADTIERRKRSRTHLPEKHPADPRLGDGWRLVWETAKRDANFCDTFDALAEALGVPDKYAPEPEPTFEGTVIATVTLDVPVFVHGLTGSSEDHVEAEGGLDHETVADAIYEMGRADLYDALSVGWTIDTNGLEQAEL